MSSGEPQSSGLKLFQNSGMDMAEQKATSTQPKVSCNKIV